MPIPIQYEQLLFSCWVRVLTDRLEPEGIRLHEIYQIEQYLNQNGLRLQMPSLKIRAKNGNLVGLMNGESEVVRYDDDRPDAPNFPPLREQFEAE